MAHKAVVVIKLAGGNDSFNMVVPMGAGSGTGSYTQYATARQGLAIPSSALTSRRIFSNAYALHPSLQGIHALHASRLAVVANCGPLITPTTKAEYLANTDIPEQLFSHSDQMRLWESCAADAATGDDGWGKAIADDIVAQGTINAEAALTGISFAGTGKLMGSGAYEMSHNGPVVLDRAYIAPDDANRRATLEALADMTAINSLSSPINAKIKAALDLADVVGDAFDASYEVANLVQWPDTTIGNSLKGIARMIWASTTGGLGQEAQIFLAEQGGYDTHSDNGAQAGLLAQLDSAVSLFQSAMNWIGADVLTLIYSEFGRTLRSNGNGSDHGWGGNALVLASNGVAGFTSGMYGTWPSLAIGSNDDLGLGRLIPTTSHCQVAGTLAKWLGVVDEETMFPNLVTNGGVLGFV